MVKAENIIMKERIWINHVAQKHSLSKVSNEIQSIGSREFEKHSESEFLVTAIEALRKNLALKCNAKRSGGFSLLTVLDVIFGHVPDDWRVSAGYHEKWRHADVKRVM